MTEDDIQKKIFESYMEEYKSLRTESLNTINNRISITGFSFTALALVGSVTVSANAPELIVAIILGFVLPLLSKTVTLVWIGEYQRSQRAGAAIALLERDINNFLGSTVLTWENTLRRRATKIVAPYESSLVLFLYIGSVSRFLSLYYCGFAIFHMSCNALLTVMTTCIFGIFLLYVEVVMRIRVKQSWLDSRVYATHDGVDLFERLKNSPNQTDPIKPLSRAQIGRKLAVQFVRSRHAINIGHGSDLEAKIWTAFFGRSKIDEAPP